MIYNISHLHRLAGLIDLGKDLFGLPPGVPAKDDHVNVAKRRSAKTKIVTFKQPIGQHRVSPECTSKNMSRNIQITINHKIILIQYRAVYCRRGTDNFSFTIDTKYI